MMNDKDSHNNNNDNKGGNNNKSGERDGDMKTILPKMTIITMMMINMTTVIM